MAIAIGIDGSCWLNPRGFGRYTRELICAIARLDCRNRYFLLLDKPTALRIDPKDIPPKMELVTVPTTSPAAMAASATGHRPLRDLLRMSQAARKICSKVEVFFFPAIYTFYPVVSKARVIVTFHDTIAEDYKELIFPAKRNWWLWRMKVWCALKCADYVATVSETSRKDLIRRWHLSSDRTWVIPNGVDPKFRPLANKRILREIRKRYHIPAGVPLFLYVGGLSPHKNVPTLLKSFKSLVARIPEARLVLAGPFDRDVFYTHVLDFRTDKVLQGLERNICILGYVTDDELVSLYNMATATVLPSFAEGFGLPSLESMACGTPVIASFRGALPEVIGDAGLYFEPDDDVSLTGHMIALVEQPDLRDELSQRALIRAEKYSWTNAARAAIELFERAARDSVN